MRIQKHEIRKYMFWGFDPSSKEWHPYGSLYGYNTPEEAMKDQLITLDKKGNVIDEKYWKDREWKIVEII